MKKTLLAGASMAVLLTAANALAAEYTGNVETTAGNTFMVEAGSTIKDATFDLKAEVPVKPMQAVSVLLTPAKFPSPAKILSEIL